MSEQKEVESVNHRLEIALTVAVLAMIISLVCFLASAWHAEMTNQRLDRLENIERIDSIGRRR